MKKIHSSTILLTTLVAVLHVGCKTEQPIRDESKEEVTNSEEPFKINGKEQATLRLIRSGSWAPLEQKPNGDFPVSPGGIIQLKNETGLPVCYDFTPFLGDMDNFAGSPTIYIVPGFKREGYIPADKTAGIRILEPVFFHDGALLMFWTKSAKQEDGEKGFTIFDSLRFQRITGEEMRKGNFTITIANEVNK